MDNHHSIEPVADHGPDPAFMAALARGEHLEGGARPSVPTLPIYVGMECERMSGRLGVDKGFRLFVSGDFGPKEINALIRLLEAQKGVLEE